MEDEKKIENEELIVETRINPYVNNLQTLEYYLNEKPTVCDTIKYYWTALIDNQHHKMNYIQLKSRMHRTEMFVDYYTRKGFKIDDVGSSEDVDIKTAYYIIHRIEWFKAKFTQ